MTAPELDAGVLRAFRKMADDLGRVFGTRFVALLAGGPDASAAFASAIQAADLEALSALSDAWHADGVATPVVMTPDEFHQSLDTFAAEYQTLLDHHVVIAGTSPIEGARVAPDDLRRACEAQARGHLIHLRQGWIEAGSHAHGLAHLIERSAAPLRSTLANLARLHGVQADGDDRLAAFAHASAGLPADLIASVLRAGRVPHESRALVARLPDYLAAAERLWAYIDRWPGR